MADGQVLFHSVVLKSPVILTSCSGGERALCPVQHTDSAVYLRPFTVFLCSFSFIAPVCWESSTTSTTETRLEMPALSPFLQRASEVLSSFGKLASRLTNSACPIPFLQDFPP